MTPSEFLDSADRFAQGLTEGDWRSAVSRAYYGVFHHFREVFVSHGLNLGRSGQSHFNIYTGLLHCGVAAVAPLGSEVDTLRERRVDADYDLHIVVTQSEAADAVVTARDIIARFQAILPTVPSAQIAAGARKHLQAIGKIVGPP